MKRFNIDEDYFFVAHRIVAAVTGNNYFSTSLSEDDKIEEVSFVKLKCKSEHSVPVEYSDGKGLGYIFANNRDVEYFNQYPRASYGQLSDTADRIVRKCDEYMKPHILLNSVIDELERQRTANDGVLKGAHQDMMQWVNGFLNDQALTYVMRPVSEEFPEIRAASIVSKATPKDHPFIIKNYRVKRAFFEKYLVDSKVEEDVSPIDGAALHYTVNTYCYQGRTFGSDADTSGYYIKEPNGQLGEYFHYRNINQFVMGEILDPDSEYIEWHGKRDHLAKYLGRPYRELAETVMGSCSSEEEEFEMEAAGYALVREPGLTREQIVNVAKIMTSDEYDHAIMYGVEQDVQDQS